MCSVRHALKGIQVSVREMQCKKLVSDVRAVRAA